jgi:hypothetical protein
MQRDPINRYMSVSAIQREFGRKAALIRKAVASGLLTVVEGKNLLHEELDYIISDKLDDLMIQAKVDACIELQKDLKEWETH